MPRPGADGSRLTRVGGGAADLVVAQLRVAYLRLTSHAVVTGDGPRMAGYGPPDQPDRSGSNRPREDTMTSNAVSATNHQDKRPHRPPRRRLVGLTLGLVGLTLGLVAPATSLAAVPTASATDGSMTGACSGGAWPTSVQGAPPIHAGSAAGDYLWHSSTGWRLRVTHAGTGRVVFSGTIRANKPLHVVGYHLEAEDSFTISADHLSVTYRLVNHGEIDGLNFTTECATRLGVSARMSGTLVPVRRIWLGHAGRHPLQNPFGVFRRS